MFIYSTNFNKSTRIKKDADFYKKIVFQRFMSPRQLK